MPANTSVLNQLVISSFMSKATRYVCPDFSEVAEREMLKSNLSAVSNTLRLVRSETSSGRVNARETVEIDTPAALATSRMPALSMSAPLRLAASPPRPSWTHDGDDAPLDTDSIILRTLSKTNQHSCNPYESKFHTDHAANAHTSSKTGYNA